MCRSRYAGMLAEQLGVGIAGRLSGWAYAYARDRRLSDLACAIVARRLRLGYGCILTLTRARTAERERARALGLADLAACS